MKRRGFLQGLGFGGMLGAVAAPVHAHAAATTTEEKRDLAWARRRVVEGHRVRLEKWACEERTELHEDGAVVTIRQGSPAGITVLDELVVTVEVLEGPWEVVPEEDYPKPPPPPAETGCLFFNDASCGDLWLRAGDGSAQLTLRSGGS